MKIKKAVLLVITMFFVFSTFPAYASDVISDEKMKITIGYAPYGMLETSIMKNKQFYKKYLPNVEVEWFFGLYSVHLINNWIAGKMEISYLGNMPSVMLQSKVGNTKWVGNAVYPKGDVGAIFVPNNSTVTSIKELDGKTVATGIGSSHHRLLEEVMRQEKIKFDIVNQAPEVAVGNLEAGKIDAFCYWPPYVELVKFKKIGKILPPGNFKQYEPYVNAIWPILVSENFDKKHPNIVKGLVKADLDLHEFVQKNLDDAAQIVYKELEEKLPLEVIKASLASYDYANNFNEEHIEVMQRDIDFLLEKNFIQKPIDASKWADTKYYK